jgi:hypothetical protein
MNEYRVEAECYKQLVKLSVILIAFGLFGSLIVPQFFEAVRFGLSLFLFASVFLVYYDTKARYSGTRSRFRGSAILNNAKFRQYCTNQSLLKK